MWAYRKTCRRWKKLWQTRNIQLRHQVVLMHPWNPTRPPHLTSLRISLIEQTRRFHYPRLPCSTFPFLAIRGLSATHVLGAERGDQRTIPEDYSRSTHHGPHDLALSDAQMAAAMTTTMTMTMWVTVNSPPNRLMANHPKVLVRTHSRRGSLRVPFTKQTLANTLAVPSSSYTGFATSSNISAVVTFRSSTATAA